MRGFRLTYELLVLASIAATLASRAAADEGMVPAPTPPAVTLRSHTSVAILAGYGLPIDTFKGDMSPYRVGFGVRAGVTFGSGVYIGGTFVKHVGTVQVGTRGGDPPAYLAIAHATYAGPELGWELRTPHLLLRPFVGSGVLFTLGKTSVIGASVSDEHAWFFVAPGGLAALRLGELFAGVDLRLPIVPAQTVKQWAPAAMLVVGLDLGSR